MGNKRLFSAIDEVISCSLWGMGCSGILAIAAFFISKLFNLPQEIVYIVIGLISVIIFLVLYLGVKPWEELAPKPKDVIIIFSSATVSVILISVFMLKSTLAAVVLSIICVITVVIVFLACSKNKSSSAQSHI